MLLLTAVACLIWLYLLLGHGWFWQSGPELPPAPPATVKSAAAPTVAIVIPARDEAPVIAATLGTLLAQDYAGPFRIILVDDGSTDGTGTIARALAPASDTPPRLTVLTGAPRPPGWSGKLWAVAQGVAEAGDAELVLLTDADIEHWPGHLAALVAQQQRTGYDMISEMVALRCESLAQRALVPAFVLFFQLLYPFSWVNDSRRSTAAAAGGTILLRRDALARIGGIEAVRDKLIDDVALAAAVKRGGPIWLGHSTLACSVRPYPGFADIWRMVARTAYVQLGFSPLLLVGTTLGMALVFLLPPAAALFAHGAARWLGLAAWAMLSASTLPTLRRYHRSVLWAPFLPLVAAFYMAATVGSAVNHYRGRSVAWKGRTYQGASQGGRRVNAIANVEAWSGKDRGHENFPVGSHLIRPKLRPHVHAFYTFARNADDIANSPTLPPEEKVARLDVMEAVLLGRTDEGSPSALALRDSLARTRVKPIHATELLIAFRLDATKHRYATLSELYEYCRYSAAPVGRYVLDLHRERHTTHAPSDALCSALQILNHMQDCVVDLERLDRCYLPEDLLAEFGSGIADLRKPVMTPALRKVFDSLLHRVDRMTTFASDLPPRTRDRRLRLETAVIVGLAKRLANRLARQDPLARRVKLSKLDFATSVLVALRYL